MLAGLVLSAAVSPCRADFISDKPNVLIFPPVEAKFVRLIVHQATSSQVCIDEFEVYGDGPANLALASAGAKASASSCIDGHLIHKVAHLNDGLYGNDHSWIAAGTGPEWATIELPKPAKVSKVILSRDRAGRYHDRLPGMYELQVSMDGKTWKGVLRAGVLRAGQAPALPAPPLPVPPYREEDVCRYAFDSEDATWSRYDRTESVQRVLKQFEAMIQRFAARGIDVSAERKELADLTAQAAQAAQAAPASPADPTASVDQAAPDNTKRNELYYQARLAKRRLFLRDPDFDAARRILLVKRHPYEPSHNYSVIFDARGGPGGSICTLDLPMREGRLDPLNAKVTTLFESSGGIARDPTLSLDAKRIFFSYRRTPSDYFRLMVMNVDGSDVRQISDGPFHDYFPCPLPDGGLAFISTRCKAKFLCWRPQAFVLFRMDADGGNIRPLSYANVSEWTPALMHDGRILWMRSEYLDKGANFGHTLWAIRPDGTYPELIFGNNTINCYANGHEVPGSRELLCTLVAHGGDLNGPVALLDPVQGVSNPQGVTSITPDVPFHTDMSWPSNRCFRDPIPVSRDLYLCSHAAATNRFALYAIDRWGNREILHLDPTYGCMGPSLLRTPDGGPALQTQLARAAGSANDMEGTAHSEMQTGQFVVADVYHGLEPAVKRGTVRYLRVCQEERANLIQLANGQYQADHEPFMDWYATPVHKVSGPFGWPSYVAKGVWGLANVEEDGSANFLVPAGKVVYLQALDADYNEIQRMRSVVQLQGGEKRSCLGCHESRSTVPRMGRLTPLALRRPAQELEAPSWGAGPFAYEKVVQPVLNAKCVRCHDAKHKLGLNYTAILDVNGVPASYRTLIQKGLVHYFDWGYGVRHSKAQPLTFGTVKSRLWQVLDTGHKDVKLTPDERHRIKCWIDLNCPLWPDYLFRPTRLAQARADK